MSLLILSVMAILEVTAQETPTQRYQVRFDGLNDSDLVANIRKMSSSFELRKQGVISDTHLRRRMNADTEQFAEYLHSEGYYWHTISSEITKRDTDTTAVFTIDTGPRAAFGNVRVTFVDIESPESIPEPSKFDLTKGMPARAELVLQAETQYLTYLRENGYPFPIALPRDITVDSVSHTMDVELSIDQGQSARFGSLHVSGLDLVKPLVVELEQPWEDGEVYDIRKVELFRKRLYDTGLFSVVQIQPLPPVENGYVVISVDVVERSHRTFGIGGQYYSDEGAGIILQWEHRNIAQEGRKLDFNSHLAQEVQDIATTFTIRNFRRKNQTLKYTVSAGLEERDAYDSEYVGGLVTVNRRLSIDNLFAGAGISIKKSWVEQLGVTESFNLLSFPVELTWDNTEDLLDPKKGFRAKGQVEPFIGVGGEPTQFLKTQITASTYRSFDEEGRWILALRARVGSIFGDDHADIPADERFYSGGGGSVRGYPYQSISPLTMGEPVGGLSQFETSIELRNRITKTLGTAFFLDGGSVFSSRNPQIGDDLRWGAGFGFRYFSPIGPFRFDVAFPLDKESNITDDFQVYISIGQAF